MGAYDRKSAERQRQPDFRDDAEARAAMEREIRLLFGEMNEILRHPATRYELFPRLSAALWMYWRREKPPTEGERLLHELDKVPHKDDEIGNLAWQRTFATLERGVTEAIAQKGTRA